MNDIFNSIEADYDALVGSADVLINKRKATMKPTETQINLWKTYAELVQNLDLQNGDADGQHELNQYDAIEQIAKDTNRDFNDVRKDINVVCNWLTTFTRRSK